MGVYATFDVLVLGFFVSSSLSLLNLALQIQLLFYWGLGFFLKEVVQVTH